MNTSRTRLSKAGTMRTAIFITALGSALAAAGCHEDRASPVCSADPPPSDSAVLLDVTVGATAGARPFAMDTALVSDAGVPYSVSLLRFYVSHVELIGEDGRAVPAPLADAAGKPLTYGVALVDYARPETLALHLLAAPRRYTALSFSIGVPARCVDGGELNHEDASEQSYPLDVDSDMYWAWNPGYVFFKVEGHATGANGAGTFAYHVGDDRRFATVRIPAALDVVAPAKHALSLDVNRLFVSPSGEARPDMTGVTTSNDSHDGPESDMIRDNYTHAEVFQWID